jgi:RNA polymerase sigma-70 factor (ECF subfamily)
MGENGFHNERAHFDWRIEQEIPHLRRYAHALVHDTAQADDLVQDCLERALRKWRLWGRRNQLRGWLFRMLYRVELNRRRAGKDALQAERGPPGGEAWSEDSHVHRLECRDAIQALQRLPAVQRDAVLLVALEDMSYEEAAWVLDVPLGTLRSRVSRGRETLRQICGDEPRTSRPAQLRSLR